MANSRPPTLDCDKCSQQKRELTTELACFPYQFLGSQVLGKRTRELRGTHRVLIVGPVYSCFSKVLAPHGSPFPVIIYICTVVHCVLFYHFSSLSLLHSRLANSNTTKALLLYPKSLSSSPSSSLLSKEDITPKNQPSKLWRPSLPWSSLPRQTTLPLSPSLLPQPSHHKSALNHHQNGSPSKHSQSQPSALPPPAANSPNISTPPQPTPPFLPSPASPATPATSHTATRAHPRPPATQRPADTAPTPASPSTEANVQRAPCLHLRAGTSYRWMWFRGHIGMGCWGDATAAAHSDGRRGRRASPPPPSLLLLLRTI